MLRNNFGRFLFEENKEGGGGGGGDSNANNKPDFEKLYKEEKARNDAFDARFKALEGKTPPPKDESDLADKVRKDREAKDKSSGETKRLESALKFNMESKDWLKTNASLLPKSVEAIFAQADRETYDNAVEKDCAIKVGLISEFFAVQSNLELLTPALKTALEDFLKLTKNSKQERAQGIYDTVFEPAFEMLKRVKKAEQLRAGVHESSDAEAAYKQKLIKGSRSHYLGEKANA